MTRNGLQVHRLLICSMLVALSTSASAAEQRFENLYPFPQKTFWTVMKWRWNRQPAQWPKTRPVTAQARVGQALTGEHAAVTWIGHASFLVEFENFRVLMDPVYSPTVGPHPWISARRVIDPGIRMEDTPKVDLILLSHNHFDHMDLPTLEYFARRDNPLVITGLGNKPLLEETGFKRVVELDWWNTHKPTPDSEVTFVPAQHWSTRSLLTRNNTLWGGFFLKVKNKLLYFVGDTGYHNKLFKEIRARVGTPDFSFIPIGAYAPRDFMRDQHVDPVEAVDIHQDVGSKQSVGMHWGTIQLSDEGIDEPCQRLNENTQQRKMAGRTFTCMAVGETRFLFAPELQAGN